MMVIEEREFMDGYSQFKQKQSRKKWTGNTWNMRIFNKW